MASPSPSHSWGDDSDALACLPSLPSPSSGADVEGWGDAGDALSNLLTLLSSSSPNGSDKSWGGAGDALEAAVTCSDSLSDAWGCAGDALDVLPDSLSALHQEPIDADRGPISNNQPNPATKLNMGDLSQLYDLFF
jgi:hypothetical protein